MNISKQNNKLTNHLPMIDHHVINIIIHRIYVQMSLAPRVVLTYYHHLRHYIITYQIYVIVFPSVYLS